MPLALASPAFQHNGSIPVKYTCDGDDVSPPLEWTGVPANSRSVTLIVDDPDAPDPKAPKRTWVHWVIYNLPPRDSSLAEGVTGRDLPTGAIEGTNDWQRLGYGGPCPPIGRHRYFFKLFALDIDLPNLDPATKADVEKAMAGHIIENTELIGTYERP